jgi:hypothetical protein
MVDFRIAFWSDNSVPHSAKRGTKAGNYIVATLRKRIGTTGQLPR